ncbi:hypothetical protein [Pseudoduganella namucuonensis]|uniref:Uncharacterized protein n=1 Tax=Pseudoduganella namucuonensis TaxID=1035707 RepID=A0A1I7J4A1_9BURK|nr:hypothetical protein [Pseudoduganella namucuonensis]SFU79961.1 hypothetical protein SAMN05216552_101042 [Pseudoduganella namucuonensis]
MNANNHSPIHTDTGHGLLQAELHVLDGLPPELAQGMFAGAAAYPTLMRLSGAPGSRAMSIKVLGLDRGSMPGAAGQRVQDFVLGGEPDHYLLGETYFSQARILFGARIAQVCVTPVSAASTKAPDGPALREAMVEHFARFGAEWELRVSIEDGPFGWLEDARRYRAVARIVARPQPAWSSALARVVERGMSFSPWHCVAAHQPMGAILRGRRDGYGAAARFRGERPRVNMREPYNACLLPS